MGKQEQTYFTSFRLNSILGSVLAILAVLCPSVGLTQSAASEEHRQTQLLLLAQARTHASSDRDYQEAERAFPAFCRQWEQKLKAREQDNLAHLQWSERNGYKTATYVGYGPIEVCTCKHSPKGPPVGKIVYREIVYYLVGRTVEEAMRNGPKVVGSTNTVELFNWSDHRWQY